MFNANSRKQFQVTPGHDSARTTLHPLQPTNSLNRPELRAVRDRHNSGSLSPLNPFFAASDQTQRREELQYMDSRQLLSSMWTTEEISTDDDLHREGSAVTVNEKEELLVDRRNKENQLEKKLAEVEDARKTAEDRHQREVVARNVIERRASKLEKKVSEMDDALKNAEKRFQRETNARNAIEKHVARLEKRLTGAEETLVSSEKRWQRELNVRNMIERRVLELEKKLSEMTSACRAAENLCKKETDVRNTIGDSVAELRRRVIAMDDTLRSTEERYQSLFDSRIAADKRALELDQEVRSLQGRLMAEKTAVDVEKGKVQQLQAELVNTNFRLEKEAALLRSERMKTRILADREAERMNMSPEERVSIAQEKLKVLSSALDEEREKSKKLKEALAGVQSELSNVKREASDRSITFESPSRLEMQEKSSEQIRGNSVRDHRARYQLDRTQADASSAQDQINNSQMSSTGDLGNPTGQDRRSTSQNPIPQLPSILKEASTSEQQSIPRSEASQKHVAQDRQSATELQRAAEPQPVSEQPNAREHYIPIDQRPASHDHSKPECQPSRIQDSALEHHPTPEQKPLSEDKPSLEQEVAPVVLTQDSGTSFRPALQEQPKSSLPCSSQLLTEESTQRTVTGPNDNRENSAPSQSLVPAPRYPPRQKFGSLQKLSGTQGYSTSHNLGRPMQRFAPSQLFAPRLNRARSWDLDHPDNFAPRQHLSYTETPFQLQFAPIQPVTPSMEVYNGPQLMAQPQPVDNPQKPPFTRRPLVSTATRSLYTADVAGTSRMPK